MQHPYLPQKNPEAPRTFELIVIDQAPIRGRALHALKNVQSELDLLNREWALFREKDKPAFASWLSLAFANLNSEIQAVGWKIHEKRIFIQEVFHVATIRGVDYAEAYRLVISGKANEAEITDEEAAFELFEEELRTQGFDPREMDEDELDIRFGQFKAKNGLGDEEAEFQFHSEHEDSGSQKQKPKSDRLKKLYRELARRLHPDALGDAIEEEAKSLWLKVQSAYEAGDLPRLESILAMLGAGEKRKTPQFLSVWEIKQLAKEVLDSIAAIRRRLRGAHRDRAWGFSRPEGRKRKQKVYQAMRRELEQELQEAQDALATLEDFIEIHFKA